MMFERIKRFIDRHAGVSMVFLSASDYKRLKEDLKKVPADNITVRRKGEGDPVGQFCTVEGTPVCPRSTIEAGKILGEVWEDA